MDIRFQDKIDDYLLDRMNDEDKKAFLEEVEQDAEKKEQLEFTRNVKDALCSREEKLKIMAQWQQTYERGRKASYRSEAEHAADQHSVSSEPSESSEPSKTPKRKIWFWVSGVAAVLLVGFFAYRTMFMYTESPDHNTGIPTEQMRGDDEMFDIPVSPDSVTVNDTTTVEADSIINSHE